MTTPPLESCRECGRDPRIDTRQSYRRFDYGAARVPEQSYAFVCSDRHCVNGRAGAYSGNEAYARQRWNKQQEDAQ